MTVPIRSNAIDPDLLIDGAVAALLANAALVAITTEIHNEVAPERAPGAPHHPYVVLNIASAVAYGYYNLPGIDALMDVSCYAEGMGTTTVRAMLVACQVALLDKAWTAPGLTISDVSDEMGGTGTRNVSTYTNGVMVRGRQFTLRIHATKP